MGRCDCKELTLSVLFRDGYVGRRSSQCSRLERELKGPGQDSKGPVEGSNASIALHVVSHQLSCREWWSTCSRKDLKAAVSNIVLD